MEDLSGLISIDPVVFWERLAKLHKEWLVCQQPESHVSPDSHETTFFAESP